MPAMGEEALLWFRTEIRRMLSDCRRLNGIRESLPAGARSPPCWSGRYANEFQRSILK